MTAIGIVLFLATLGWIVYRYFQAARPCRFPRQGYIGAGVVFVAEVLMFAGLEPVATYFTPIAWTGYIFWADAAVYSIRGRSLWKNHRTEFAWLALCSIPLWLIFEAYNLRLANWVYVGLPQSWLARHLGYAWSFATIGPAILEPAALVPRLAHSREPNRRTSEAGNPETLRAPCPTGRDTTLVIFLGALLLLAPLLAPQRIASYLFGAVWLGFIFFLEPINCRLGSESLWKDLRQGRVSRLKTLLVSGFICGLFWEFWNYWAQARWVYTVPILPEWKMFAMPLVGYLGFPPFGVECFALFAFLAPFINRFRRRLGCREDLRWAALGL